MTTTVDLTEHELTELKAFTKETDDAAAVRSAMTEYLRFARRLQFKAMPGQVEMDDNWQALEAAEVSDRNAGSVTNRQIDETLYGG